MNRTTQPKSSFANKNASAAKLQKIQSRCSSTSPKLAVTVLNNNSANRNTSVTAALTLI